MRKYNPLVVIIYTAFFLGVIGWFGFIADELIGVLGHFFLIILLLSCWVIYLDVANWILYPIAKRNLEKNLREQNFTMTRTFETRGLWNMHSMLCIEESTGRVAYTSTFNPFKFQMIHASELRHVQSAYSRGPFGGTRYVFLQFYYNNKRFRFPTFVSRVMMSLSARSVQEALAEGEELANLLRRFTPPSVLAEESRPRAHRSYVPFAKGGIIGFIFAFIALDINAVVNLLFFMYSSVIAIQDQPYRLMTFVVFLPGILLAVVGLILAISSLIQASKTPMRGKGFAIAATALNAVQLAGLAISLTYLFSEMF